MKFKFKKRNTLSNILRNINTKKKKYKFNEKRPFKFRHLIFLIYYLI